MAQADLNNLLKQAQQMQAKMQKAQEELTKTVVVGEAGGGFVKVKMNGRHDVSEVYIDPSLIKEDGGEDSKNMLEDLIAAAVNDAVRKIEKASRDKLTELTAGMQLPTGFGEGGSTDVKTS